MKRHWALKALAVVVLLPLFFFLFGYVTMSLWNWLMPGLFGLHVITFWQAIGILILGKLIFGGFRGGHCGRRHWRGRMKDRWEHMSPEEREKFREGMRGRCGSFGSAAPEPKT
jgi:Ca2+/H+ antiporter, TMEM165/GDT1 family